jgi:hypothetical protein
MFWVFFTGYFIVSSNLNEYSILTWITLSRSSYGKLQKKLVGIANFVGIIG